MPPVTRSSGKRKADSACDSTPESACDSAPAPPPTKREPYLDLTDAQCCICKELIRRPMSGRCGHSFCELCLADGRNSFYCPICRKKLKPSPNYMLRSLLEQLDEYKQHCFDTGLEGTKRRIAEKLGEVHRYSSSYPELTQIAILNKVLSLQPLALDSCRSLFVPSCLVLLSLAEDAESFKKVSTYIQCRANTRSFLLDTDRFMLYVEQSSHDSTHPLRV